MAKLLAFAASLREDSLNRRLLELEIRIAKKAGAEVKTLDLNDFALPLYNQEIQDNDGFPAAADEFKELLEDYDGFILAQPEYNYGTPGFFKNLIDWQSRYRPQPFRGLHGFLSSASPSLVGGNRGLWDTVQPLLLLGVHVYPNLFSLSRANMAFNEAGTLQDAELQARLAEAITSFIEHVTRATA